MQSPLVFTISWAVASVVILGYCGGGSSDRTSSDRPSSVPTPFGGLAAQCDSLGSNVERGQCLADAQEELGAELSGLVEDVAEHLDPDAVGRADEEFLGYVDAQCALERLQSEGGTEASINEGKCRVRVLEDQVARMRGLIESVAGPPRS